MNFDWQADGAMPCPEHNLIVRTKLNKYCTAWGHAFLEPASLGLTDTWRAEVYVIDVRTYQTSDRHELQGSKNEVIAFAEQVLTTLRLTA